MNKLLNLLTDMRYVYTQADTMQKRDCKHGFRQQFILSRWHLLSTCNDEYICT
ncbi:MAG: hypothetical protein M3Z26_04990 [Bacteroidota bacterium]|nr:hypothetical protein [Bacteroidota bacterium]